MLLSTGLREACRGPNSLLRFGWGSLLGKGNSLENHLLLAAFPKLATSAETWPPIWEILRWSCDALGKGIIGDHEFFSNVLFLPHWSSHHPCWECDAENFEGANPWKRYKEISLEKLNLGVYSHQEQLDDPWSDHAIFRLPRVSPCMVRGDPLHILFCKGLYSHLIGCILHYVCYLDGPGKRQPKKPWERLSLLFSELQVEYSNRDVKNRLTNLRISVFTDTAKPWS